MRFALMRPTMVGPWKFIDGKYRPCRYRLVIRAQVGQPVARSIIGKVFMLLFIVNIYMNAKESMPNIEALLRHGHSVFVFIDGPSNDAEVFKGACQSSDRLHVFTNTENLGLLGARIAAWKAAIDRFDISAYRYVTFIDGGKDQILPDALSDFQDWTTDVVELNCIFRQQDSPKYGYFKRHLTGALSPAHGFLSNAIINNVWNKYIRPEVLNVALIDLEVGRLNFGEDLVITGLVCASSRTWSYIDRVVYIYDNRDSSLSRPVDPCAVRRNYADLKQAFDLVRPAYATHQQEIRALLYLKWQRNRVGTGLIKVSQGQTSSVLKRVAKSVFRESLKLAHGALAMGLVAIAAGRESLSSGPRRTPLAGSDGPPSKNE
ncbi:MAG: hypothetical protein CME02_06870 [Geminicoccus sp.]|nr:hypothetical protein [Geminicoccus sp.]